MQVRKLSGTSAMGYSREGLENRLNTAYFDLDKKMETTLKGCSLAEGASEDFQQVRYDLLGQIDGLDLSLDLSFSVYLYLSISPTYVLRINEFNSTGGEAW